MKPFLILSACVFAASVTLAESPAAPAPAATAESKTEDKTKPVVTTEKEITTSGENSNSGRANQPSLPNPVDGRAMPGSPAQQPANLVPDAEKNEGHQGSVNPVQPAPAPTPAKEESKKK